MRTQPTKKQITEEFLAARNPLMGKLTKKQAELRAQFNHLVRTFLKSKGATKGDLRELTINTTFGPLECTPYEDWVACRFVELRAENWRPSRPSGKWNFHYDFKTEAHMLEDFEAFKRAVNEITK